jgi:hypothetical protein
MRARLSPASSESVLAAPVWLPQMIATTEPISTVRSTEGMIIPGGYCAAFLAPSSDSQITLKTTDLRISPPRNNCGIASW